jgi:hypothetical protein
MANIFLELEKLRAILKNKGLDARAVETIVSKATREIYEAFEENGDSAMQLAIELGVEQRSPEFINELRLDSINLSVITDSGNTEFTDPPFPMLDKLLQNAKPMKDGSGVYKIIPVGSSGTERPKVSTNIYDAAKQINAERAENARRQYQSVSPKGSKGAVQFRTATSKQDATRQWVIPAKTKDFTEDMKTINQELSETMESKIRDILRSYEEGF